MVWIAFGLVFKVFRAVPRHEQIVARIIGHKHAPVATRLMGLGECVIGVWMLSGWHLPWCALAQTVLVVTVYFIELRTAPDLLVAPLPMIIGNVMLLTLAWFAALARFGR